MAGGVEERIAMTGWLLLLAIVLLAVANVHM